MYYQRKFQSGASYDPRSKWFAVYKCNCCDYEAWIEIKNLATFDYVRERKCPKCNNVNMKSKREMLILKKKQLDEQQKQIKNEIEKIIGEIEKIESVKTGN